MPGVKLVSKQACTAARNPLVLAAGTVTYQTKSGALDSQLLPSHQPLKVSLHLLPASFVPCSPQTGKLLKYLKGHTQGGLQKRQTEVSNICLTLSTFVSLYSNLSRSCRPCFVPVF